LRSLAAYAVRLSACGDAGTAAADLRAFLVADELEHAQLGAVTDAVAAELDDAGVAARAIREAGRDVVEDVLDDAWGLAELAVAVALDLSLSGISKKPDELAQGLHVVLFLRRWRSWAGRARSKPRAVAAELGDHLAAGVEVARLALVTIFST
jgi:hypothetical protein